MVKKQYRYIGPILSELNSQLDRISSKEVASLERVIMDSNRIFLAGAGRSGLIIEAFAMRLMHLGLDVKIVGDSVTPAAREDDLLLIASGSGETSSVAAIARKAESNNLEIALLTESRGSTISKLADKVICLGSGGQNPEKDERQKIAQPLGSPFEHSLFIVLESLVSGLMDKKGVSEKEMEDRHANLE